MYCSVIIKHFSGQQNRNGGRHQGIVLQFRNGTGIVLNHSKLRPRKRNRPSVGTRDLPVWSNSKTVRRKDQLAMFMQNDVTTGVVHTINPYGRMLITGRLNHSPRETSLHSSRRVWSNSIPHTQLLWSVLYNIWGLRKLGVVVRVVVLAVPGFYLLLPGPSPVFVLRRVPGYGAPLFAPLFFASFRSCWMEIHCARTTRAGEHAPLGNEEMRNVTTRPKYGGS